MDEEAARRRRGSRPKPDPVGGGGGVDLISTLPDDLLLQVLERLGSDAVAAAAAARTSTLSRRWRGLWSGVPKVAVTLHDVPFASLRDAVLRLARPGSCHYLLDIRVPAQDNRVSGCRVSLLLHAAATLSPAELRLTLPRNFRVSFPDADLPCFRRATSVELQARDLRLGQRMDNVASRGQFHMLERLSLSGCRIDLATFIPRCPRLRLLRLSTTDLLDMGIITIHSGSLEELVFEHKNRWEGLSRISVEAPLLRQLTVSFHARNNVVGVSILAPMVEKVSWRCLYTRVIYGLGLWALTEASLSTPATQQQTDSGEDDACLQLPTVHVLSLHMCAQDSLSFPNAELSFATEIEKHMVTNFSGLDLHLTTKGHAFGAFVLHLLGMHQIRISTQNLKIVLLGSEVKDACPADCRCVEPKDWRTQSISSLAGLEKVEIEGVKGEDHEIDFLKVIFRCAPMLKNVTVKLSDGVTPSVDWCTEINDIVKAYPVVQCDIGLGLGSTVGSQSCESA